MRPSKFFSTAAVAALTLMLTVTAGCAETKSPAAPPATKAAQPKDLKGLLVNPHTDTTGDEIVDVDFKQVAEGHLLAPPPGMAFAPDSCVNYVLLGDAAHTPLQTATPDQLKVLNGWMQFNKASPVGKDHNLGHDNFFAHFVVEIPNLDLSKIKQGALACTGGTITLDGTVKGTLVNTEVQAKTLAGAQTFSMTQRLAFDPPKDSAGTDVLKKYYGTIDANGGIVRLKHVSIVVIGNVFYLGIVPEAPLAEVLTTNFYKNAGDHGLRA